VIALPDDLSDERAVFLKLVGIAMTPQLLAPIRFGEHALVIGLGMVGNLAAQLCREAGAHRVFAADRSASRRAIAQQCGIAEPFAVEERPLKELVAERIPAPGPSYLVEAVGLGATIRDGLDVIAPDGRLVILSSPRTTLELDPYFDVHHPGVHLIGAHEWRRDRAQRKPYESFLQHLLATQRVHVDPLVTHRIPFGTAAQQAYEGLHGDPDHYLGVLMEYS
jgi:threonine dehydrogenase-like Zn-dependent dehydrogenase